MTKTCKRPGNEATETELREAHIVKMGAKVIVREHNRETYGSDEQIFANLSLNHPNWGISPIENERRMSEKVVDKSA